MSYNEEQRLEFQEKRQEEEPEQLLLARQPQDQLIDFGEIGGFLRDKNDELGNSLNFGHHDQQLYPHEINFDDKHNNERNLIYQHHHHHNDHNDHEHHYGYAQNQHQQEKFLANGEQVQNQQVQQDLNKKVARRKCICKKTQCLKMYCECFASNLPCTEQCTCLSCKNTLEHQKEIFEAKMLIQQKGIVGLHSCSLSEKRCNCKKSGCLKKYCECYNSGVKCSQGCKCIGCKNCQNPKQDDQPKLQVDAKLPKAKKGKKKQQKLLANHVN